MAGGVGVGDAAAAQRRGGRRRGGRLSAKRQTAVRRMATHGTERCVGKVRAGEGDMGGNRTAVAGAGKHCCAGDLVVCRGISKETAARKVT